MIVKTELIVNSGLIAQQVGVICNDEDLFDIFVIPLNEIKKEILVTSHCLSIEYLVH